MGITTMKAKRSFTLSLKMKENIIIQRDEFKSLETPYVFLRKGILVIFLKNKEEGKPNRDLSEDDFKKEITACLSQENGIIDKLKK